MRSCQNPFGGDRRSTAIIRDQAIAGAAQGGEEGPVFLAGRLGVEAFGSGGLIRKGEFSAGPAWVLVRKRVWLGACHAGACGEGQQEQSRKGL